MFFEQMVEVAQTVEPEGGRDLQNVHLRLDQTVAGVFDLYVGHVFDKRFARVKFERPCNVRLAEIAFRYNVVRKGGNVFGLVDLKDQVVQPVGVMRNGVDVVFFGDHFQHKGDKAVRDHGDDGQIVLADRGLQGNGVAHESYPSGS